MRSSLNTLRALNKSKVEIPTNPTETYVNEYDIINLDRHVVAYLKQQENEKVPLVRRKLRALVKDVHSVSTIIARLSLEKEQRDLEQRIQQLSQQVELYQQQARPFLEVHIKGTDPVDRALNIERYLQMIQPFYPHNIHPAPYVIAKNTCFDCQATLIEEDDLMRCPECNRLLDINNEEIPSSRITDNKVSHFIKILDQVEGKTTYALSKEYSQQLTQMTEQYRLNQDTLTRADIVSLVYAIGDASHYQHISQIGHQYAGIPLPDYSEYREVLIRDYCLFSQVYETLPKDLTSALNGLYVLYRLLNRLNVKVELVDLRPPVSEKALEQYEDIWERACQALGWNE